MTDVKSSSDLSPGNARYSTCPRAAKDSEATRGLLSNLVGLPMLKEMITLCHTKRWLRAQIL